MLTRDTVLGVAKPADSVPIELQVYPSAVISTDQPNATNELPRWLRISLRISTITALIMFIGGPVVMAFGGVARDDLLNDDDDKICDQQYIKYASRPWDDGSYIAGRPGRYHAQCRLLVTWSYILTVAGSISIVRTFIEIIPPYGVRCCPPASIYAMRTIISAVAFLLYLSGAIILGRSPVIIGPDDGARAIWSLALAAICQLATARLEAV
ncbi:hypothetical protein V493_05351 [Pseudogymnoascus sp. VKM F-4281 (FW-2241)]|nr:hypothetical protein V493_05351 [Pseudogymnoascus sp. VKM F-4281 (FW-2241)]